MLEGSGLVKVRNRPANRTRTAGVIGSPVPASRQPTPADVGRARRAVAPFDRISDNKSQHPDACLEISNATHPPLTTATG
jgi:hypothetical protein